MTRKRKDISSVVDATQAGGVQTITLDNSAEFYTVTCVPNDASTTGTLAFDVKTLSYAAWENLIDADTDAQLSIDLADGETKSFMVNSYVGFVQVTPTAVSDSYSIYIQQGSIGGK